MSELYHSYTIVSESVRIRCQKIMSKYNLSIQYKGSIGYCFLDSFNGYYIDDNGKKKANRKRESLKITLFKNPKNPLEKEENKRNKALAERIVSERNYEFMNRANNIVNDSRKEGFFMIYFDNFVTNKGNSISDTQVYHSLRNQIIGFRGDQMRIQDIDYAYCRDFLSYLQNSPSKWGKPKSSSTINSYYKRFRLCLKEIVKEGILPKNPTDDIKVPKPIHKEREYLTKDEVKALINTPMRYENLKRFFLLSCFTGLRHSDVKRLTWKNVIVENKRHFLKFTIQKTKEPIKIPLSPDAVEILGERRGDDDKVVAGLVYSGWHNMIIKQWGVIAGIRKEITPHIARHTFATLFASQTKDWKSLQYILGHSDIRTTQVYAKLINEDVQDSMDKMEKLI
ncbi:MAG: Tyrosine recombinase XerD [Formosa sp. Hel1_33_131]|nr:MAG: Tyrosine recombinase XerD [Formosa sp. Hel1_33_131]